LTHYQPLSFDDVLSKGRSCQKTYTSRSCFRQNTFS